MNCNPCCQKDKYCYLILGWHQFLTTETKQNKTFQKLFLKSHFMNISANTKQI